MAVVGSENCAICSMMVGLVMSISRYVDAHYCTIDGHSSAYGVNIMDAANCGVLSQKAKSMIRHETTEVRMDLLGFVGRRGRRQRE